MMTTQVGELPLEGRDMVVALGDRSGGVKSSTLAGQS